MQLESITFDGENIIKENYEYVGLITKGVDGDTTHATVDLGGGKVWASQKFGEEVKGVSFRLHKCHAFELSTHLHQSAEEIALGYEAKAVLEKYLYPGRKVAMKTIKDRTDAYDRYLAEFFLPEIGTEKSLNIYLMETYPHLFKTKAQWNKIIAEREIRLGVPVGSIGYGKKKPVPTK